MASVTAPARAADVPVISFSNDTGAAGPDVFIMGHVPGQSIARTIQYARTQGSQNFAIIAPDGEYGARAEQAARSAVALTEKEVIFVALAARTSVREFDGGARLFKTSFLGLPLWAFADYVSASTGAREALNMDGAVSTQMMVRLDGESFKVIGERGVINAVELRLR